MDEGRGQEVKKREEKSKPVKEKTIPASSFPIFSPSFRPPSFFFFFFYLSMTHPLPSYQSSSIPIILSITSVTLLIDTLQYIVTQSLSLDSGTGLVCISIIIVININLCVFSCEALCEFFKKSAAQNSYHGHHHCYYHQ